MNRLINAAAIIVFILIYFARSRGYITGAENRYYLLILLLVFVLFYYRDKIISLFKNKK